MSFFKTWKRRAKELKQETYALSMACRDPRTPWYIKLLAIGVIAYALSPIDLIPDFIPVLGHFDDLILIPLGILLVRQLLPAEILQDCRREAGQGMGQGRPVSRVAAAFIITLWLLLAGMGLYAVWWKFVYR
ncbi:MAG TPA: DUF1232 domain-containing protein [Gemmataceae bacterium]|nr:DUF1232 domain-containing protein [Gemmataceae bacterium]